jgi:hypothetical protein
MDSNKNLLQILSAILPIEEGEKAEYEMEMTEKLLGVTKNWIEVTHHVMVNVVGM